MSICTLYTVDIFLKYIKLHRALSAYAVGRQGRYPK